MIRITRVRGEWRIIGSATTRNADPYVLEVHGMDNITAVRADIEVRSDPGDLNAGVLAFFGRLGPASGTPARRCRLIAHDWFVFSEVYGPFFAFPIEVRKIIYTTTP